MFEAANKFLGWCLNCLRGSVYSIAYRLRLWIWSGLNVGALVHGIWVMKAGLGIVKLWRYEYNKGARSVRLRELCDMSLFRISSSTTAMILGRMNSAWIHKRHKVNWELWPPGMK